MYARIIETCDAVVQVIQTAWSPTGNDGVERAYGKEIALSEDYASGELLIGRRIYVFPANYNNARILDRKSYLNKYVIAVLIVERFTEQGPIPDAWMDERVLFVEQKILGLLVDTDLTLLNSLKIDPEQLGQIDIVYDRDLYMQRKTFWSLATFVYQEAS